MVETFSHKSSIVSLLCVNRFSSLTEVSSKGSHFAIKERGTQKHTQTVKQHFRQPAADRNICFQKRLKNKGFANKTIKKHIIFFATVNIRVWRVHMHKNDS